jgi:hypothetical protein
MISIGGDDWEAVVRDLDYLARHVAEHGAQCGSISGGYSGNHIVEVVEHPDMTHDRYFEELATHLAEERVREQNFGPKPGSTLA